jgi:hypothetical protein
MCIIPQTYIPDNNFEILISLFTANLPFNHEFQQKNYMICKTVERF